MSDKIWQVECSQDGDGDGVCCKKHNSTDKKDVEQPEPENDNKSSTGVSGGYTSKIMKLEQKYKKL